MSKKVLNSFNNLVQVNCFYYDRYDRTIRHKDSNLSYSKDWINKNEGLTEDEIRGKFNSMVDEYDITLLDELFIEVEDNKKENRMIEKNFKLILQNKRQQLNEDLILTDSRDMRIGLQAQIELIDSFIKPLFAEMVYNESEYQEQIVRLQIELDRVTYNG